MSTSPSESARLAISAADNATEIFLIDANLRRIASGLGQLEASVNPGIYKVRFRSGASQHDQLVEVSRPGERVTVQGPPVLFRTAAPIDATLTTHEYQSGPAAEVSKRIHLNVGTGGGLFVFVREEDEDQAFLASGLTVHALDGTELAALEAGETDIQARWGALNLGLDPGTYSIRVVSGRRGSYEIFATVSRGWQTQVFLLMDEFWSEREPFRAPSLRSASVLMSRQGQGFDPYSDNVRLAELARHGLAQGRNIVSSRLMNEFLYGKFEDPMLGVIAAHLLMRRRRPDRRLLHVVSGNLFKILGEHPDLQALLIAMKIGVGRRIESFERPPSLRQSWDNIVKASRRRATLVQPDSPIARIADGVMTGGPWLIHRIDKVSQTSRTHNASIAEAERVVEQLISVDPDRFREMIEQTRSGEEDLSGLERGVLAAAMSYALGRRLKTGEEQQSARSKAKKMFSDLSAPSYSIANAVISVADKMKLS
ncbi:MAG: hypothetical protein O7H39_18255 [Gammaproteobacteria bacterium]|nr:hypothetical protein [Gammaproteobacteria bacterium]